MGFEGEARLSACARSSWPTLFSALQMSPLRLLAAATTAEKPSDLVRVRVRVGVRVRVRDRVEVRWLLRRGRRGRRRRVRVRVRI